MGNIALTKWKHDEKWREILKANLEFETKDFYTFFHVKQVKYLLKTSKNVCENGRYKLERRFIAFKGVLCRNCK